MCISLLFQSRGQNNAALFCRGSRRGDAAKATGAKDLNATPRWHPRDPLLSLNGSTTTTSIRRLIRQLLHRRFVPSRLRREQVGAINKFPTGDGTRTLSAAFRILRTSKVVGCARRRRDLALLSEIFSETTAARDVKSRALGEEFAIMAIIRVLCVCGGGGGGINMCDFVRYPADIAAKSGRL